MKNIGTKTIETERLILRRFKESDIEPFHKNWSTDRITHEYSWYYNFNTIDDTKKYVLDVINKYSSLDNYYHWVIELKENHEVIGHILSNKFISNYQYTEIGYSISSKYFNQGLMTEALKKIVDFYFNEVGLRIIEATCISENIASINLLKNVGFNLDAILPERSVSYKTGKVCDTYVFSIINRNY